MLKLLAHSLPVNGTYFISLLLSLARLVTVSLTFTSRFHIDSFYRLHAISVFVRLVVYIPGAVISLCVACPYVFFFLTLYDEELYGSVWPLGADSLRVPLGPSSV